MVRAMCRVQLKDRKIYTHLMFKQGLNETIDQLVLANSAHWDGHVLRREHCHVLRREHGHVLIRALDFEVAGQRKKERLKRTWKRQVEEESVKDGLRRKDELCRLKWSVGVNQIAAGLR